jgi:hypothetical protein
MKKIVFITCCLFGLISGSEKVLATHIAGADLTYTCLGGNTYRFYFTLYRDCSGIAVSQFYSLMGASACGDTIFISLNLDSTSEVAHTCSTVVTQCMNAGSAYRGFEANYYHGEITLPAVCNYWTFGLQSPLCNRNTAINTLYPNGGVFCFYIKATLDNSIVQCNNSPVFGNLPLQFLCADQVQYYSVNAFDPDGDSLTYKMITPHHLQDSDVIYMPGLSGTQPVYYNFPDSTTFDTLNGLVRFKAAGSQITVMAVQVNEYRNGILIGTIERDIELIFESCINNLPTATGINGSISHVAHVCALDTLSFIVTSNDADISDQTELSWNTGIPGATFLTSGTFRDTGYFSWQPGSQDIRSQPYPFTVTVKDNACPTNGSNTYTFLVFVDSCSTTPVVNVQSSIHNFSATYFPESESIRFQFILEVSDAAIVSLYDVVGRKMESFFIEQSNRTDKQMAVNGLSRGVYLLNLKTEKGESQTIKVTIE